MLKVVVDTNKLIASLLREGKVRRILFYPSIKILLPEYTLQELKRHKKFLEDRVSPKSLDFVISRISKKARIIQLSELSGEILDKARSPAKEFDIDDYPFIAVAIEYDAIIWTNDKKLIEHALSRGEYLAIDTSSLERLLRGEELSNVMQSMKDKYLFGK